VNDPGRWQRVTGEERVEVVPFERPSACSTFQPLVPDPHDLVAILLRLIREMSVANPLWGAPPIHGELVKLGMDVGQTNVAKYIGETTMAAVAALEDRRHRVDRHVRGADDLVWASLWTSHPAAFTPRASVAGCDSPSPCGMACPSADRGLRLGRASTLLDPRPDGAYGAAFIRRIRAMGIRDRPFWARSARSDGNVLITSSSLASAIFATFSHRTKERTYRCRRTRRFGVTYAKQGACVRRRSWAGYTINMFEFEFRQGQGIAASESRAAWTQCPRGNRLCPLPFSFAHSPKT
jgi:hypothetical protein